jgi:putative ABC transport system permease protein
MNAICWIALTGSLIFRIFERQLPMRELFYMAWRYLAYNRVKTMILVLSVALIVFLPVGLRILVGQSARSLTARAETTPLLVGAKGSPLELVLNSLYFESDLPPSTSHAEVRRISDSGLAHAIPLYTRFRSRGFPIVGTTIDYFDFRSLKLAAGRRFAVIGECVLGAEAARSLGVEPRGHVVSSPESVFDFAGVYPLKMKVVGVLEASGTPDDRIVLVDLKTAWIIEGLAHGHQDMSKPEAAAGVLKREGDNVVANASVMQYNEITPENMDSFHFHGNTDGFPVSAVIAVPFDEKSGTLLQGQYLGDDERVQIVKPKGIMDKLLGTILTVQNYVIAAMVIIGFSTLMTAVLVFMLSLRLRKREIETMHRIGGSRVNMLGLICCEIAVVVLAGCAGAGVLTLLVSRFAAQLIRSLVL